MSLTVLASQAQKVREVLSLVLKIANEIMPILFAVVGVAGSIWCIFLGVRYAKASDPQEHAKAKKGLIDAIVGFVLIFVVLIACRVAMGIFVDYYIDFKIEI